MSGACMPEAKGIRGNTCTCTIVQLKTCKATRTRGDLPETTGPCGEQGESACQHDEHPKVKRIMIILKTIRTCSGVRTTTALVLARTTAPSEDSTGIP